MRLYKLFSITMAAIFGVVGCIFLFFPDSAINFFNLLSDNFNLPHAPVQGTSFYLILASAYMYLVTVIAILMYRCPEQESYPFLLTQGKIASSAISLYLFFMHQPYLIYLANCIVDGFIGAATIILTKRKKREYKNAN